MKLLGATLIVVAGSVMGFRKAYELQQRITGIMMLQNAFRLLETEIFYTRTPIPQAMGMLEVKLQGVMQKFFHQVYYAVEEAQMPLYQAWEEAVVHMAEGGVLCQEELSAMRSLGNSLGAGDIGEQQKNFQLFQQRLQQALSKAERNRAENARIWKYMGVCVSMVVVLLLY